MKGNIKWQGYEWLTQERWGQFHPDKPIVWYDPSAVTFPYEGILDTLSLKCRPNPKSFKTDDGDFYVPVGTGLISCTTEFGYGKFEIKAKLPSGPFVWPAFWMWSFDSWPPEIDVFEGYTNKKGSYFNWSLRSLIGKFWAVNSNIHIGETPNNYNIGAKSHWLGWNSPDKVFNRYGLVWDENEITILFNDKIVRKITDEKTLSQFRGKKMNVIINNSIQEGYLKTDMPETEFVVKYFKYTKQR